MLYKTEAKPAVERFDEAIQAAVNYKSNTAEETSNALDAAVTVGRKGVVVGVGVAIVMASVLGFAITRTVAKALNNLAVLLSRGSNQVASASSQGRSSQPITRPGRERTGVEPRGDQQRSS